MEPAGKLCGTVLSVSSRDFLDYAALTVGTPSGSGPAWHHTAELATEEGESKVLRRLQVIDMARGLLNSLVIDAEGEDYDFKTFQFSGINDVVSASCNMLSALSNIPQTILFGQAVKLQSVPLQWH